MEDAAKTAEEKWYGIIHAERLDNPARIVNICACESRNEIQVYP